DEGAPALRALVPVAFAGGGPAHHEFADLAIGELAPVLVDDLHVVSRHRLAGRSVADLARPVAQEGLQHFGRAEPVENVDAHDRRGRAGTAPPAEMHSRSRSEPGPGPRSGCASKAAYSDGTA